MKKEILSNIKGGEIFSIAGVEFIKFFDKDGITTAVAKGKLSSKKFNDSFNAWKNHISHGNCYKLKTKTEIKLNKILGE